MKHLKQGILCLLLICVYSIVSAQKITLPKEPDHKRPKLFVDIPDRVPVAASVFLPLLNLKSGQPASISLSDKFTFDGTVVSVASKYNGAIKSIVLKSTNRAGANLSISQTTNPDGSLSYQGRIVSFQHGDCFELKTENGQYILVKRNFEDMVND
ncbi:MAG: hypothetical protein JWM28_1504 [Chitinophagaceae bacterium]|nr:hypothetical protein [Chitinophagaceae bacterium]